VGRGSGVRTGPPPTPPATGRGDRGPPPAPPASGRGGSGPSTCRGRSADRAGRGDGGRGAAGDGRGGERAARLRAAEGDRRMVAGARRSGLRERGGGDALFG